MKQRTLVTINEVNDSAMQLFDMIVNGELEPDVAKAAGASLRICVENFKSQALLAASLSRSDNPQQVSEVSTTCGLIEHKALE